MAWLGPNEPETMPGRSSLRLAYTVARRRLLPPPLLFRSYYALSLVDTLTVYMDVVIIPR